MPITVDYQELDGYPRSGWESGEFDAERRVLVAWDDRVNFLFQLDTYPNNTYPYSDGPADAIVRRVKIFPFDACNSTGSLADYDWAVIQILHSTRGPQWSQSLGCQVRETFVPAAQYGLVSRQNLRWYSDNKKVEANDEPRLDYTLGEYIVRFENLLTLPAWVLTRPGVINSGTVPAVIMPIYFNAKTLKYNGCVIETRWSLGKIRKYDVTARYLFKASMWNYFWRPDGAAGGGWDRMKTKDGVEYIQHEAQSITIAP